MLDHIMKAAQTFENTHGTSPDIVYINPSHYECLYKHNPELFSQNQHIHLGFRLVIMPGCTLIHPKAAMLPAAQHFSQVA
ncbi:MAG TPA: hypothetical protein DCO71_04565 [Gammaproteobacteria bacterium]|nr:hypothetical protein [Gammaproteobacteria bacterium]